MKYLSLAALVVVLTVASLFYAPTSIFADKGVKTVVLTKRNLLVINDAITDQSVAKAMDDLQQLGKDGSQTPLYLFLYTPGGSIAAGLSLLEAFKGQTREINTITMFAASMGFQLVQNLNNRYILESGVLMSHHATGGEEGQIGGVEPSQLRKRIGLWEKRVLELDEQTVRRTKGRQTLDSYQKAYDHELWLTGQDAIAQGYADEIVRIRCDVSLSGTTTHETSFMGITLEYDVSNCPINVAPVNVRVKMQTTKGTMYLNDFLANGGSFGADCHALRNTDSSKLCAVDANLTIDQVSRAADEFVGHWRNIGSHPALPANANR